MRPYPDMTGGLYHSAAPSARASILRRSGAAAMGAAALALVCAAIGERARIVAFAPGFAPAFAAAGLPAPTDGAILENISSSLTDSDDGAVLFVDGQIANPGSTAAKLADLRVSVAGPDGREIYHWATPAPKSELKPGETIAFRAKLVSPPANAKRVSLRFATPDDDAWLRTR